MGLCGLLPPWFDPPTPWPVGSGGRSGCRGAATRHAACVSEGTTQATNASSDGGRSVLTIGHSRHPIDRFLALLAQHHVELLVDARSHPASRFSPQFARKALERAVLDAGLQYRFLGDALGGRPPERECYDADGKLDYDRVEQLASYQRGIAELVTVLARSRACVMCAEEDPARCHRRLLIARTLIRRGVDVFHIRGSGALEPERAPDAGPQLGLFVPAGRRTT